ncbi:MAG: glycosyltransferase [Gammaproteobacteria bacterium]|nr:glycosyltransferase [Gammaproteobacteria bacterium]
MTLESSTRKLKILVQAYACEPGEGSEPGVGWYMCQAISKDNEAWVITRKNNKDAIDKELSVNPNHNLNFIYTDLPKWLSFWKKGGRGIRTYYYLWQFAALLKARMLLKTHKFDIAHHITFVNDWLFSSFSLLPLPFIWGPIGSHPKAPATLVHSKTDYFKDRLRYGFQSFMRTVDPLFWICAIRSRLVIGISKDVGNKFPLSLLSRHKYITHTAIGVEDVFEIEQHKTGKNILSIGRLVPIKAFHLTIDAFNKALQTDPELKLTIIGKGPLKSLLIAKCETLGIQNAVTFLDWLPRTEALDAMNQADIFLFPSFEGGGMVVLEAMANGVPVICLDYGGPGEMARSDFCEIIAISDYNTTVNSLSKSLLTQTACENIHKQDIQQWVADHYLWSNRYLTINSWYKTVLNQE